MNTPLVSCIMVTGKSPERIPLARAAIRSFQQQTYENKELVILNTGEPLLSPDNQLPGVTECYLPPELTLGELRNNGLNAAAGDYIAQWDDDDFSRNDRIERQVELAIKQQCPVTLLCQIRYSFTNNNAFIVRQRPRPNYKVGIPGTVLHPKTVFRYPAERKHEDTHFLQQFGHVYIHNNDPEMYLRFEHGANTWSRSHIMQQYHNGQNFWNISPKARTYLQQVLTDHYAELQSLPPGPPGPA